MISRIRAVRRLPVLATVVALLGVVAPVSLVLAAPSGSAAPVATSHRAPAQRYITAAVNKKEVKKGKKVTISGAVQAPDAPTCAAGVTLSVERSTYGAVYKVIGSVTTDAAGAYRVKEVVKKKARYRISAPLTDACVAAQSPPRSVKLKED